MASTWATSSSHLQTPGFGMDSWSGPTQPAGPIPASLLLLGGLARREVKAIKAPRGAPPAW